MGWKRRKRRWLSRRRRILGEVNQPREKSKVVAEIAIFAFRGERGKFRKQSEKLFNNFSFLPFHSEESGGLNLQ